MKVKEPYPLARMRHVGFATALTLTALFLAACSSTEDPNEIGLACPAIGVLADADKVTLFSGEGQDLTDTVVTAEIDGAVSNCSYDTDERTIYVNLAFGGSAELGPAAQSREVTLQAFAVVTAGNKDVVRKTVFDIPLAFAGASRKVQFSHTIEDTEIRYPEGGSGADFEILVGFQLTPDQVAYNRLSRAR